MDKEIRFIDSRYNELFRIPDGGKIWIKRSNGEYHIRQCKYHDDYHFELLYENKDYGTVYHICQFAEQCEHNCIKYAPVVNRHYNIERPLNNETEFAYVVRDAGCAARLGGEISSDGHECRARSSAINEAMFTDELHREIFDVLNYLRYDELPILKNADEMKSAADSALCEKIGEGASSRSVFKIRTDKNTYYVSCDDRQNFSITAYDTKILEQYKDVQFVHDTFGDELKKDKFIKTDSGFTEIYYNPNAAAGGQIVTIQFDKDDIKEAAKSEDVDGFFDHISSVGRTYLTDAGTPEFISAVKDFVNTKTKTEGCSTKTMNALKRAAGIEVTRKKSGPER